MDSGRTISNTRSGSATNLMKPTDAIRFHVGKVLEAIEASSTASNRGNKPHGLPPHTLQLRLPVDAQQVLVFVIAGGTSQTDETATYVSPPKSFDGDARVRIVEQPGETTTSTIFVIDQWKSANPPDTGITTIVNKTERLDTVVIDVTDELRKQPFATDAVLSESEDERDPDWSAEGLQINNNDSDDASAVPTRRAVKQVPASNESLSKRRRLDSSPVTCEMCRIQFASQSAFNFHPCQQEKDESYFVCKFCGEKYNDQNDFWSHYRSHVGGKRAQRSKCLGCTQAFSTPELLQEHCKKCSHASHFQCTLCEMKFYSRNQYRKHKRLTHLQKYACQKCSDMFSTRVELIEHRESNHSLTHQCRLCTESFPDKASLLKHKLDIHTLKMHTCDVCDKSFTKKSTMGAHRAQHFSQGNSNVTVEVLSDAEQDELKENAEREENTFACEKCGCSFVNESALQTHMLSHSDSLFPCNKCNDVMQTQEELFRHKEQRHEVKLICEQCGRQYLRMRELRKHMSTHSEERPFPCATCGFRFYTEDRLRTHQRVHEEKRFLCNLCPMKFTDNEHLRRHLKSHTNTNRQRVNSCVFHCLICPETFESPARLVQHYDSVHPVAQFTCVECDIHVASFDLMKTHFRSQHVGQVIHCCRVCGDAFNTRHKLEAHRTNNHKVARHQQIVADTKITCSACQKTFCSAKLYNNHLTDAKCKEAAAKKIAESTPFTCLSCNEEFPTNSYLLTHNAVHGSTFPFPCNLCGRPLVNMSEVTDHLNQHVAIGTWSCVQCNRTLSTRQSLRMHMASHGIISPFTCTTCNKTFNSRGALATHTNIHTGEQPYRCNLSNCNARFKQPNQLKAHLLAHDGRKTYECAECSKTFWARSALVSHLSNHVTGQDIPALTHDCNICSKSFNHKSNLSNHLRRHKGEKGLLKKRFGCKRCKRTFTTQAHLIIHEQTHDGAGLVCPVCQKKFKTLTWLQMHMRIHTSESPICPICDKSFTIQRSLEQHMAFHNEQCADVQCPTCNAKFKSEHSYLKHNVQCHSGFSGQVCRLCGLGFATLEKFNDHVTVCDIKQNRRTTENLATSISTIKPGQGIEEESASQEEQHHLMPVPVDETGTAVEEIPGAQNSIILPNDSCHLMMQDVLHAIEGEKLMVSNPEGTVELDHLIEGQVPTELILDGPQGKVRVQLVFQTT